MEICQIKLTIILSFCLIVPSILATHVTYCDKKGNNYDVKVKGVEMHPDPVVSGEQAEFKISASTGKHISGGEVTIEVNYFGIHVHSEKIDLCKESSCPIEAGDFILSHVQTLPAFTPPGSYTLKMSIAGNDNQLLTCIRFGFKIALKDASHVSEIAEI